MVCVAVWPIVLMLIFILASTFATGGIVSGGTGLVLKRPRRAVVLSLIVGFVLLICSGWSGIGLKQMLPTESWDALFSLVILLSGIGGVAVVIALVIFRALGIESAGVEHKKSGSEEKL